MEEKITLPNVFYQLSNLKYQRTIYNGDITPQHLQSMVPYWRGYTFRFKGVKNWELVLDLYHWGYYYLSWQNRKSDKKYNLDQVLEDKTVPVEIKEYFLFRIDLLSRKDKAPF